MLIKHTLFSSRPEIGGRQVYPLTAGRLLVLEEMGNPLGTGDGENVQAMSIYEAFLVAITPGPELEELTRDAVAWKRTVRRFSLETPDEDLNAFWFVFEGELKAAADKMTEAVEQEAGGPGKPELAEPADGGHP